MSLISNIFKRIFYKLIYNNFKPEIIAYKDSKGNKVLNSRVSILTHISNKENIVIGENVFIGHFNYIDGFKKVIIGEGCQITNYVNIVTHSSHDAIRLHGKNYITALKNKDYTGVLKGTISIGDYTYIGPHVLIMPSTNIGKGCIISAHSYVKGNIPDYSIVRGIPAKIVGDTRNIDEELLIKFPDLKFYYNKSETEK